MSGVNSGVFGTDPGARMPGRTARYDKSLFATVHFSEGVRSKNQNYEIRLYLFIRINSREFKIVETDCVDY